ncbi:alpha-amylase family glycosyl hydrolase [Thermotoga sp. SG1]|uniref:alpha-amylase family glycosyl hydrolase n=1 Tax=Thermotoga sp. SG1 TaxID=126739 RepID=UPI001304498D|nr:alpha-amylase family glycosyl hydrolase [Thermotoga sp. SG1]
MVLIINIVIHFALNKDLSQALIALVTYPFGLVIFTKEKEIDFQIYDQEMEEDFPVLEEKRLEILPLKGTSLFGTPNEKKKLILQIAEDVKSGKVSSNKVLPILRKMVLDSHPDVGLYASEAIEKIEEHFGTIEESLDKLVENLNEKNIKVVLDYIKSGFLDGDIGSFYKNILKKALTEKLKKTTVLHPEFFSLLYEIEGDISILLEGFLKTKSQELYKQLLKEILRKRNYEVLKFLMLDGSLTNGDKDSYNFVS